LFNHREHGRAGRQLIALDLIQRLIGFELRTETGRDSVADCDRIGIREGTGIMYRAAIGKIAGFGAAGDRERARLVIELNLTPFDIAVE